MEPTRWMLALLIPMAFHAIKAHFGCIGTCYSGRFLPESQDIFRKQHLKGFSYKNITTDDPRKCYSSCTQDCRCKACQMKDSRCELLDEDKTSKADSFTEEIGYVYYDLKQTMLQGPSHMLPPGVCYNGCCRSQPCLNGGTCTEHCQSPKEKFTCKCTFYYRGKVCEIKNDPTSCTDVKLGHGIVPESKVYNIKRFANEPGFDVYCDFTDPNRTWTLVESFSLANNNIFEAKAFTAEFSYNAANPPSWSGYRLGKNELMHVLSKSTLFRATCEFQKLQNKIPSIDTVRGRILNLNFTSWESSGQCHTFDYINIGGNECHSCTSPFYKVPIEHVHMDPTFVSCSFKHESDVHGADYFGFYNSRSSSFTCTATSQSTTQWWFGTQDDY